MSVWTYSVYDTLAMENASGSNYRTPKLNTLDNLGRIIMKLLDYVFTSYIYMYSPYIVSVRHSHVL